MIKLIGILKHCEKWREREVGGGRVSDMDNVGNKKEDDRQEGGHHSLCMFVTFDTSQSPKG